MTRYLLSAVLLCTPLLAGAEGVSLEQAVELALKNDPRIKEREHLVEAAKGLRDEATGSDDLIYGSNFFIGVAPTVKGGMFEKGSSGGTGGSDLNSSMRDDGYDVNGLTPWYNLQFTVIKPLATFGKIENYTAAAEGNIKVQEGEVNLQRASIVYDVHRAYYGYLTAKDTRLLLEDVRGRLNSAVGLVQGWLEKGTGTTKQSDLFALQTGVAVVNRYIAEADSYEKIAMDGLKTLTSVGLEKDFKVADSGIKPVELPKQTLKQLTSKALTSRPEMKQLEAGLSARRSLVEAKKSEFNPNVYMGLAGGFAYTPGRDTLNNPYIYDPFNWAALTPIVGVKWDWSSGVQPARVKQAQSELDALVEKSAFARQGIPFQVAEQYHMVQASHTMVEEMAQASRAGRRWMIASYADFEAGLEQADKVMSAFQGYVLAHSEYLKSVNDYNLNVVRLKQVTGEIQ